jgi:hypothetical protein
LSFDIGLGACALIEAVQKMKDRQPMAGQRQKMFNDPSQAFETREFANRRKKARARAKLQKASRRKNR